MLRGITLTEAEERLDPLRKRREGESVAVVDGSICGDFRHGS